LHLALTQIIIYQKVWFFKKSSYICLRVLCRQRVVRGSQKRHLKKPQIVPHKTKTTSYLAVLQQIPKLKISRPVYVAFYDREIANIEDEDAHVVSKFYQFKYDDSELFADFLETYSVNAEDVVEWLRSVE
jgi:hypothetical protein